MKKASKILGIALLSLTAMLFIQALQPVSLGQSMPGMSKKGPMADWSSIEGPVEIGWKLLIDIDYEPKYFEEVEMELYAPIFSEAVKAMDRKEVLIKGYVIPLDAKGELYALSANPYASCFFCGQASPASVISLQLKNKGDRYKTDDLKRFRGVLVLNYDDPNQFCYILKEAR
ncbi:MAG: DUF3299 domain-containing protein [Bacteroidota bacterium]